MLMCVGVNACFTHRIRDNKKIFYEASMSLSFEINPLKETILNLSERTESLRRTL